MSSPYDKICVVDSFTLTSSDISDGQDLAPAQVSGRMGYDGTDTSPQLAWSGFPHQTRSFAVTMFDPDAPTPSGYWHWAVGNLPASVTSLATGAADGSLPGGAIQLHNDGGFAGFLGAAPPPGHGRHRYVIGVHALDLEHIDLDDSTTPAFLCFTMFSHTLARGVITGWWQAPDD
jgi:Raf kinase inhibitor-like YbhB/YbcL family protein